MVSIKAMLHWQACYRVFAEIFSFNRERISYRVQYFTN